MRVLYTTALILGLSACAASGVKVDEAKVKSFQKGKATVQEVIGTLGRPSQRMMMHDGTSWVTYVYSEATVRPETFIPYVGAFVGGVDTAVNTATFRFDQAGVLIDYSSSERATGTGMGFASGVAAPVETNQPRRVK